VSEHVVALLMVVVFLPVTLFSCAPAAFGVVYDLLSVRQAPTNANKNTQLTSNNNNIYKLKHPPN
jgi:hypothetical protein